MHAAVDTFLTRSIDLACNACRQPHVRNALSNAALYLNVKYPLQETTHLQATTRLLILGTPAARSDYFDMIRQNGTKNFPRRPGHES